MNTYTKVPKLIVALVSMAFVCQLQASTQYRYVDESQISNRRKIAVLAYGSLVHQPANADTGAKIRASSFEPTSIMLPVSLSRLSSAGKPTRRITAVIDNQGQGKQVYVATSEFTFLPNARQNLAAREGTPYKNPSNIKEGYKLDNIFYMKKLLRRQSPDDNESMVQHTDWATRKEDNPRQQIPVSTAQALARWADQHDYTAMIWASFPPNIASQQAVVLQLLSDEILLRNTQDYVKIMPGGGQTALEKSILSGESALASLLD